MIEAAAAVVEAAILLILGAFEIGLALLVASMRPWRYVFSSTYRKEADALLADRGGVARVWYFAWGTLALLASVAFITVLIWFFWPEPRDEEPERAAEKTQMLIERARSLTGAK